LVQPSAMTVGGQPDDDLKAPLQPGIINNMRFSRAEVVTSAPPVDATPITVPVVTMPSDVVDSPHDAMLKIERTLTDPPEVPDADATQAILDSDVAMDSEDGFDDSKELTGGRHKVAGGIRFSGQFRKSMESMMGRPLPCTLAQSTSGLAKKS